MLTRFSVKNYRGFKDKVTWDLSHPNNYSFNEYAVKDGIVKDAIIWGVNGAGKSNFSLAIFDLVTHLTQKSQRRAYFDNYIYADDPEGRAEFEYSFRIDGYDIDYCYTKDGKGALRTEKMSVNGKEVFSSNALALTICDEFQIDKKVMQQWANNDNGASVVNYLLASQPLSGKHYLIRLKKFVKGMLWYQNLDERDYMGLDSGRTILEEYIIANGLVKELQQFLLDVSGQNFTFAEHAPEEKKLMVLIEDRKMPFLKICSTGTRGVLLLFYWWTRLDEASLLVIDEFDAFYHFMLSFNVCKKLFEKNIQVFLTSHNTYLLTNDLLRPDCNFILRDGSIKPLSAMTDKELRQGHNMEKLFRGGAF